MLLSKSKGLVKLDTGIKRKVDELGRIVLPIEIRRSLDIEERDSLEIYLENDSIVLKKWHPNCVFCNSQENVTTYKGKHVCKSCIKELKTNKGE